ncbi:hypothetical protein Athai_47660 [Actinocatenispora thailandica]|uniref:Sensor domain-containing protein n=1 Tax=Actinocatenispora thailandica TaxID=227318 RepID=A0A7R7HYM9_9ACTN|nr:hypothetical protein [Actinocatenispora thailandica]BCJ37263.1 hypothetical protein Athai_47660 [Actinocatenispora thailandica]
MNRGRSLALAALVAATLALAACSTGTGGDRAATGTPSASPMAASPTSASPSTAPLPSSKQLAAALPAHGDVPSGYTKQDGGVSDSGTTTKPAGCATATNAMGQVDHAAQAEVAYADTDKGLLYGVGVYAFREGPGNLLDQAGTALRKCARYTATDPDGTTSTVTLEKASFPKLGDDRVAFQREAKGDAGITLGMTVAYLSVGHCGVFVAAGGVSGANSALAQQAARATVDKLHKIC